MSTREILAIAVIALGLSIIAEWLLILTWNRTYFTVGLPIITRRIPVAAASRAIPQLSAFQARFADKRFRELGPQKYGFVDRVGVHTAPWTHGLIIFDNEQRQVVAKGFINWYATCLFVAALYGLIWLIGSGGTGSSLLCLPAELIFIGLLYAAERSDYSNVAVFAAEAWSRPSAPSHTGT